MYKLKITKQSLNRVIKDLKRFKMIRQVKDEIDTRKRLIYLGNDGKKIYKEIFEKQKERIFNALKD